MGISRGPQDERKIPQKENEVSSAGYGARTMDVFRYAIFRKLCPPREKLFAEQPKSS